MRRKPTPFPPSAGEVFVECQNQEKYARDLAEAESRKGKPLLLDDSRFLRAKPEFTPEELADERLLINHASYLPGHRYHMRPDKPYGYLTRAEAQWVKENQGEIYRTERAKRQQNYRDAAE